MADITSEVRQALMFPAAFAAADKDVQNECWTHIHDAIRQVQDAPTADSRKAMLGKLPPHIRERVEEWVKAFWNTECIACGEYGLEIRELPLAGITALVRKKGP